MNGGEPETVRQVTPEAVGAFHHDHFGPAGSDADPRGRLRRRPDRGCRALPRIVAQRRPATGDASRSRLQACDALLLIDRPGAVQADVRLGGFGIDRLDPRWAAISVASYAMGGAFLSRLNAVLREEKGYTYGVRMNFGPLRTGGSFAVQGSFRTEVVVDALAITRELDQGRRRTVHRARRSTTPSPSSPVSLRCGTPPPMGWLIRPRPRFSPDCLTTTSTAAWRCCVR